MSNKRVHALEAELEKQRDEYRFMRESADNVIHDLVKRLRTADGIIDGLVEELSQMREALRRL